MQQMPRWFSSLDATARGALKRARDESDRCNLPYIGTEQVLLGLLAQPRGTARRVLRSFGLELDSVRATFDQWRATSQEHVVATAEPHQSDDVSLSKEAKAAIEHAVERAGSAGPNSIATEHLLLGILDLDAGAALELLKGRGVDLAALRARIVQVQSLGGRALGARVPSGMVQMHTFERPPDWEAPAGAGARNNVVMCRLDDAQVEAIDILIEAGVRPNRSDAAAWLIRLGLESKTTVVDAVRDKVTEIRRIREDARMLAEHAEKSSEEGHSSS
jgi:ATP-dependent Clp protease ATP-binding subunit ClpA